MAIEKLKPMISPFKVSVETRMVLKSSRIPPCGSCLLRRKYTPAHVEHQNAENAITNTSKGKSNTLFIRYNSAGRRRRALRRGQLRFLPARIRIVGVDPLRNLRRLRSKILLVDHTVLVHDEGHHAAHSIGRRIRDQREALAHLPIDDIAALAARRRFALSAEHPKDVPVKRR